VARCIVVAFRMPPAGVRTGPEGTYLTRARSLCARGEALGGRLVAWSAALLAMAWDTDSIEEAILLAVSIHEESPASERAWACGIAEGELEPLAPDGARMQLAWGEALFVAASLARIAKPREVLVDGDLRALRAGQLALLGARTATETGQRVRGWRLDMEHPWRRPPEDGVVAADVTDGYAVAVPDVTGPTIEAVDDVEVQVEGVVEIESDLAADSPGTTQQMAALVFSAADLSTSDVLEMVEASVESEVVPPASQQRRGGPLADRVRKVANGDRSADAIEALAELRRVRARVESGPATARCQAALALAMTLAIAGRPEEALLEALDALARARETQDPKAIGACTALLVKLYASAGRSSEATAIRESR
jgi:hypothetical protein